MKRCDSKLDHIISYFNQRWPIVNRTLKSYFRSNLNQNVRFFIQESQHENVVCKMVAILSWPQRVQPYPGWTGVKNDEYGIL